MAASYNPERNGNAVILFPSVVEYRLHEAVAVYVWLAGNGHDRPAGLIRDRHGFAPAATRQQVRLEHVPLSARNSQIVDIRPSKPYRTGY
jgi:hypothetical protein